MKNVNYSCRILILIFFATYPSVIDAQPPGLILWNKLGSRVEAENSEFGTGFTSPRWNEVFFDSLGPAGFGHCIRTEGGTTGSTGGYLEMHPDNFFPDDKTKGTVEIWVKKNVPWMIPYTTGLVNIFGNVPYGGGYTSISAALIDNWIDYNGSFTYGGIQFMVIDGDGNKHAVQDEGFHKQCDVGVWYHIGFVWDLNGIDESSDIIRLYRDNVLIDSNNDLVTSKTIKENPEKVRMFGHHQFGRIGFSLLEGDNLKVWDYTKTDFSDRFIESPGNFPEITCPPDAYVDCNESDLSVLGSATAINYCPGEVTIDYTDLIENGICTHQKLITRTWSASDECGNTSTCEQLINVNDEIAPLISGIPEGIEVLNDPGKCGALVNYPTITSSDNCEGDVLLTISPESGTIFPEGTSFVTLKAIDICGNSNIESFEIIVRNDPPVINSIEGPDQPVSVLNPVFLVADYMDNNIKTAFWYWGDGSSSEGVLNTQIIGEHEYAIPGMYTVKLVLTDLCGAVAQKEYKYIQVYDPDGMFVTGSGQFSSPGGALMGAPHFIPFDANFNFRARYQKGMNHPAGVFQFALRPVIRNKALSRFRWAFRSNHIQWLAVSGANIKMKGEGSLNHKGRFGFFISAIDGHKETPTCTDKIRIKIWDINKGNRIVYDNHFGVSENQPPKCALERGNIVIHDWKYNKKSESSISDIKNVNDANCKVYPNPFSEILYLDIKNGNERNITIEISDISGRIVATFNEYAAEGAIDQTFMINTSGLGSGLYLLRVVGSDAEVIYRTVVLK